MRGWGSAGMEDWVWSGAKRQGGLDCCCWGGGGAAAAADNVVVEARRVGRRRRRRVREGIAGVGFGSGRRQVVDSC